MSYQRSIYVAVASVALGLTQVASAQQDNQLRRYWDDNPYNNVSPSSFQNERGGGFKPADPRTYTGADKHGPLTSSEVRGTNGTVRYDSANSTGSDYSTRTEVQASDRSGPVVVTPVPSPVVVDRTSRSDATVDNRVDSSSVRSSDASMARSANDDSVNPGIRRYWDDNPYNRVDPSSFQNERGGGFKPADPRTYPGADRNGPLTSSEVRGTNGGPMTYYRQDSNVRSEPVMREDEVDRSQGIQASDRQGPVVVTPVPTPRSDAAEMRSDEVRRESWWDRNVSDRLYRGSDNSNINPGIHRYWDDNPYNRVDPSSFQNERGGGFKPADPRTRPGVDKNGPLTSSEVSQGVRSSDSSVYARDYNREAFDDRASVQRASDVQPPVEAQAAAPIPSGPVGQANSQAAVDRNMEVVTPQAVEPTQQDARIAKNTPAPMKGERAPGALTNERNPLPVDNPSSSLEKHTVNPNTVDPAIGGDPTYNAASKAPEVAMVPNTASPSANVPSANATDMSSVPTPQAATPATPTPLTSPIANDAQLDLPAVRTALSGFVDHTVSSGIDSTTLDSFSKNDRERLSASSAQNDELNKTLSDLKSAWQTKYNSQAKGSNAPLALADGFRIVSPSQDVDAAKLASSKEGPVVDGAPTPQRTDLQKTDSAGTRQDMSSSTNRHAEPTGNQINDRDPANGDRPNNSSQLNRRDVVDANSKSQVIPSNASGDQAIVVIPVAAICTDDAKAAGNGGDVKKSEIAADGHTGKYGAVSDRRIHMVRESGQWKIDLPDSKDNAAFRKELNANLQALLARQDQWPGDQAEGYRMLSAHILGAAAE